MRQAIYWNLHKLVFSLTEQGRVIDHPEAFSLSNARFCVGQKGHAKVLASGVKNVHARIRGEYCNMPRSVRGWRRVYYNPFRAAEFTRSDGSPVFHAQQVVGFSADGKSQIYAKGLYP